MVTPATSGEKEVEQALASFQAMIQESQIRSKEILRSLQHIQERLVELRQLRDDIRAHADGVGACVALFRRVRLW